MPRAEGPPRRHLGSYGPVPSRGLPPVVISPLAVTGGTPPARGTGSLRGVLLPSEPGPVWVQLAPQAQ